MITARVGREAPDAAVEDNGRAGDAGNAGNRRTPGVHFVTPEEGRDLFDGRARELLGISGDEFLRRWDAGEYRPVPDTKDGRKISRLVMLMPFVRRAVF